MASMARLSIWPFSANFEKSWMKARWMVPSVSLAPLRRLSRSSSAPRCTLAKFILSGERIAKYLNLRMATESDCSRRGSLGARTHSASIMW